MRASTGMVQLGSSYDPYEAPRRYDYDDYPSDTGYASAYGYRSARPSTLEAHQVSSHRIREPTASTKKRTEYTVQPVRHRSNTASAADLYHTPVRLAVPSTSRHHHSPVQHATHRRSPSPLPSESAPHVIQAAPRHPAHRRLYSTDYASDTGHRDSRDDVKHWTGHGSPKMYPPPHPRRHPAYDGLRKGDDIDDFDAYSYTTPREQFDRDYPVKARTRAPRYSHARPVSISGMEDSSQWGRKERSHGPPPTSWGLDKISRERPRGSSRSRDDHRDMHRSKGGSHDQALVSVPHDSDDDYSPRRERNHRPRRRHHESDRGRHYGGENYSKPHDDGSSAAMGLGTAALGGGYSDVEDYEQRPTTRVHRRTHDAVQAPSRELAVTEAIERNKQPYLAPEDTHRHARRRRSRRRGHNDDADTSDDDLKNYRQEPAAADIARRRHSSTDTSESDRDRSPDRSRHRRHRDHSRGHRSSRSRHRMLEDGNASEPRRSPPDMTKDDSRRLVAVEPPTAPKEPEAPPKGILKAPRPAFPEEPNPVREGVAPLKDASKQGIPPGARWTKIDRRLVNPEALEAGNERFEERSDYVIVLRVLSKEEIQQYAVKTQEVRGKLNYPCRCLSKASELHSEEHHSQLDYSDARHKEQLRDRRKSRDETQRNGHRGEKSSSDDEDEGDEPPKQLEAPPSEEWRPSLPTRPRASSNAVQENERPRMAPSATPA
jgi:hypothetical protein